MSGVIPLKVVDQTNHGVNTPPFVLSFNNQCSFSRFQSHWSVVQLQHSRSGLIRMVRTMIQICLRVLFSF